MFSTRSPCFSRFLGYWTNHKVSVDSLNLAQDIIKDVVFEGREPTDGGYCPRHNCTAGLASAHLFLSLAGASSDEQWAHVGAACDAILQVPPGDVLLERGRKN